MNTPDDIRAQAVAALAELGCTANEIADHLSALGITGVQEGATDCPIAGYLRQRFPGWQVGVCEEKAHISPAGVAIWVLAPVDVDLPEAVRWFIERFDRGAYPHLIQRAEVA